MDPLVHFDWFDWFYYCIIWLETCKWDVGMCLIADFLASNIDETNTDQILVQFTAGVVACQLKGHVLIFLIFFTLYFIYSYLKLISVYLLLLFFHNQRPGFHL